MNRHVLPRFGALDLCDIEHMAVREWVAELSASGLAPASVHKCAQVLSKILAGAVDARLLHHNPADRMPLPRVVQREMRHLDPDEIAVLAEAIDPRYRALVLVGAYCGLRVGEMAELRRRRVDLLRRRLEVAEIALEAAAEFSSASLSLDPPFSRA